MSAPQGLTDMRHYTVWSYAPRPTPAALDRSPPTYPAALARYLDVGRTVVPRFGAPGRKATVDAIFRDDLYQELWPYEPMWTEARRLTAKAGSPYEATVTIERWLRTVGGFQYDEHPPYSGPAPPLVDFLERTKLGYCQQFAGTMALMLRYLGIPARVAVGFTSGTWKDGKWTVTDHDAHAWVEAWFAGYGWLTFDPTPGRGTLSATYTNASDSADAIRALGTGKFLGAGFVPRNAGRGVAPVVKATGGGIPWRLIIPFAAVGAALLILALVKSFTRYRRARTSDPRRRAVGSPCRAGGVRPRPGLGGQRVGAQSTSSRSSCGGSGWVAMRLRLHSRAPATGHRPAPPGPQTRPGRSCGGSSRCSAAGSGRDAGSGASSPFGRCAAADESGTIEA